MKSNLLIGRRVLRNGLVLTTTLFTCAALQANEHEGKPHAAKADKEHADHAGPVTAESFIQKAMAGGQMEVQMGQLGQQQAQNQQVKSLAAAIVRDHTQANQKLQQIASSKNITQDRAGHDQKHRTQLDKLRSQSGQEFDKEFVKMALKHHKKDINSFERAQNQVNDPQLKSFITETLPKLRQHYQMAQTAARQLGVDEASIAADIETDSSSAAGAAAGGVKGSVETEQNRSLDGATQTDDSGTINQNTQDRATEDRDLSLSTDADVEADVDADVDDNKIFQEGDGKVLGLPTSKTDGKFLGIIPNPNADNDDDNDADTSIEADVDVDADDDAVGASADVETGTSRND